jgi:hypothetical protein
MTTDERHFDAQRGWRVGHQGRDQMYYEEFHQGAWKRIEIDGEMLMGRAHHVIYFATPERWLEYPPWARDRRAEITARITSEFREPDYEYHGLVATAGAAPSAAPSKVSPVGAAARKAGVPVAGNRALLVAVLVLLMLAAAMGWLVTSGVARGQTYLPLKQASLRRTVSREQEPVTFWISIGMYGAIGAGALVLGVLGGRAGADRKRT